MLTDDDLTHELEAAFRSTTSDLRYAGRRRPRRTPVAAVPLVAVTVTVGVVAVVAVRNGAEPATPNGPAVAPSVSATPSAAPRLVTDRIDLAGFTIHYQRRAGEQAPVHAELRQSVPRGLSRVAGPTPGVPAWAGKDPVTGENAVFVKVPVEGGHRVFALLSSQWGQDRLVGLLTKRSATTVPLTG